MLLSFPSGKGLLSGDSARAEVSPVFICDDYMCSSMKYIHNSEPFALLKCLWKSCVFRLRNSTDIEKSDYLSKVQYLYGWKLNIVLKNIHRRISGKMENLGDIWIKCD